MKLASKLFAFLTLALIVGAVTTARAEMIEEQYDYPAQHQIEVRQIHTSHAIRDCGHPMMVAEAQDVVAPPVLFPTAQDKLTPAAMASVKRAAATIKSPAYQGRHILVSGYTDNKGKDASNQRLSYHRAVMVVKELVRLGVPASQLTAQGFGSENPAAPNTTAEGRALNRRVTFTLAEPARHANRW